MSYRKAKARRSPGPNHWQMTATEEIRIPHLEDRIRVANVAFETDGILIAAPTFFKNPYRNRPDLTREQKISLYRQDLEGELASRDGVIYRALIVLAKRLVFGGQHGKGEDVTLLCHCAPKACHGDVLREKILQFARELQE